MLHRARRVAPVRGALVAALLVLIPVPTAWATEVWPSGTKALVQQTQGVQIQDPLPSGVVDLQGHEYGYTPVVTGDASTGPVLKVRLQEGAIALPSHAVTLLDFDGDGKPDVLVDAEMRIANQSSGSSTSTAYVFDIRGVADTDHCVAVPARNTALFSVTTSGTEPVNDMLVSTIPLSKLDAGTNPTFEPGLLQEPPRMLTLATANPSGGGSPTGPVLDWLPEAATNHGAACPAGQLGYDFSQATGRYPVGATPSSSVVHTDPAGDNPGGYGDLTRVAVDRYTVTTPPKNDVLVDGDSQPTRTIYPSDLTIDFASAEQSASVTYLFDSTWTSTGQVYSPKAVIRTEPVSGGKVKVVAYTQLGQNDLESAVRKYCFATRPQYGTPRSFTVPLQTLDNGDVRVSVPLDEYLDELKGPESGDGPVSVFRFDTISDPGQVGAFGPIDHVPLLAGYSLAGTDVASGCDLGNGNAGAQVYMDRTFVVGQAPPTVQLTPSTTTPPRGTPVTFDLGNTSDGTKLCSFLPAFTPNDCSTPNLTQSYQQNATAYLSVNTAAGPWDATQVDIKVQNNRPQAAISRVGTTPAQGTDGSYAIVQDAPVSIPLKVTATDSDSSSFTYRWTLDGAATPVSTADTYTPSFATPGTYTVRAYVTDDSGDPATDESVAAVQTITVVRSPQGAIDIVRPSRVVNGQPFDIGAETTSGATGFSGLTWQWDLDGDATTDFDATHVTQQLTGVVIPDANPSYLVRVRATDAGGRTADATILLNVRRANEAPPEAKFTISPTTPASGAPVTFDGSTSELSDPDGALQGPVGASPSDVRFHWSFGDGTPDVATTTPTTTHTYAGSGRPKASLIVEDLRATPSTSSDPAEHTISVSPGATDANAPTATLTRQDPPATDPVFANRPVTLSAAASTAVAGHAPLTYAFDLDGNGTYETSTGSQPTVTFTPKTAGPLTVGVKVTDALTSSAKAALALDVKAEPIAKPTAVVKGPAELQLTGVSIDGAYDATGSFGNNLDPSVTYRWDLDGDGTYETPTGTTPTVTTTFTSPGVKTIGVRVTDRYGNTADATVTTVVRSAADVAAGCTGTSSFREVSFANVRLRGCVSSVTRPSAGALYVITGKSVGFNGMQLTAASSGARPAPRPFADCAAAACQALQNGFNGTSAPWAVVLDTADGSLRSNAATSLRATGSTIDLPLLSGPLNVSLPSLATDGFTLATPPDADLGGFPLAGGVTLKFPTAGETTITVIVGLPSVLGGFTGQATIRVTAAGGVLLDELKVDVGAVSIGKLSLGDLSFVYSRTDDLWQGGGTITLPTPKEISIAASLAIQHNRFKSITAEVSGINEPIAEGIYLQALRAGLAVDPLDLTAGITVSAGPDVEGKTVLSLDGDMELRFPSPDANYYLFALTGALKLADFQLATGFAQFSSNGFFEMGGGIDADFDIGYATAYIKGWIAAHAFEIDGDAEVGVKLGGTKYGLAAAHITLSSTGFAACGEIPVIDLGGGFGTRWGHGVDAFWGCDLSPYRATRPADAPATLGAGSRAAIASAARAGLPAPRPVRTDLQRGRLLLAGPKGHLLQIPANQQKTLLTVTGATAPPRVSIVNAKGDVLLSTPADGSDVLTKQMLVRGDPKQNTTTILWKAPPGGKAWVVEQAGSSTVTTVDMALPAPVRTLGVKVTGSGRARTLHWNIHPALQSGETVSLAEQGAAAGTQLVSTAQSTGSVPFTPQGGQAGKRSITATISADGLPSTKTIAATYVAPPPPAPARPASLVLRRSSSGVLAQWAPGTGGGDAASKWRLVVRVAHTQRKQLLIAPAASRSLRIPNINPGDAVSVSLTGADGSGLEGPARSAIVKAGLRASSGPLSLASTAVPRDVVVRRLAGGKLRVTWASGAFVRGWSVRISKAANGRRKGAFTLLRTAGEDHTVDFAQVPAGQLRVSVIGRRFQGTTTRKDVTYLGGR